MCSSEVARGSTRQVASIGLTVVDEMGMPDRASARIVVEAPIEAGRELPVLSAERTAALPAVERNPGLVEGVQRGRVDGADRLDGRRDVGHLAGEIRVRQEAGDPYRPPGVGEDPVDDVLILVDIQLPASAHLDDRRRAWAAVVLARE